MLTIEGAKKQEGLKGFKKVVMQNLGSVERQRAYKLPFVQANVSLYFICSNSIIGEM